MFLLIIAHLPITRVRARERVCVCVIVCCVMLCVYNVRSPIEATCTYSASQSVCMYVGDLPVLYYYNV